MLIPYFLTVVLGNLVYASPLGRAVLEKIGYPTDFLYFSGSFTFGFFALLFLPFVLVPPAFWLARQVASGFKPWFLRVPDIGRPEYAVATLACMAYVGAVFWHGGIASIFAEGKDAISSVEARFLILKTIGLKPRIVLQSVLWFLSLYALIRAVRTHETFWILFTVVACLFVTVCLTLLNMKWPVLIYFVALLLAAFTFSRRPYIALVVGSVILAVAYVVVSASVLRVSSERAFVLPSQEVAKQDDNRVIGGGIQDAKPKDASAHLGYLASLSASALALAVNPFSRMAVSYPYYYDLFTREGPICGGPFSQIMRNPPCVPTWLIYTKVFPSDKQFAGRGTSPAAVNITGYALGGWPVAIVETILAGILLGVYAGLPLNGSSTLGALFISGAIVGYHFSQIPGEGPIIYDYGVLWSFLVLLALLGATSLRERLSKR
jgi:hypothetical protein